MAQASSITVPPGSMYKVSLSCYIQMAQASSITVPPGSQGFLFRFPIGGRGGGAPPGGLRNHKSRVY